MSSEKDLSADTSPTYAPAGAGRETLPKLSEPQKVILDAYFDKIEEFFIYIFNKYKGSEDILKAVCGFIVVSTKMDTDEYKGKVSRAFSAHDAESLIEINMVCNRKTPDKEPANLLSNLIKKSVCYAAVSDAEIKEMSAEYIKSKVVTWLKHEHHDIYESLKSTSHTSERSSLSR